MADGRVLFMTLSKRAAEVSLSTTLALDARAKKLAATGRDVINMSVCIDKRIERILAPSPNRTHHTFTALWA